MHQHLLYIAIFVSGVLFSGLGVGLWAIGAISHLKQQINYWKEKHRRCVQFLTVEQIRSLMQ